MSRKCRKCPETSKKMGREIWRVQNVNVWGEENVPENALSRKFLDPSKRASGLLCREFLYRKNRALTPEGGGKRTVRGGGPKPLFGRGVIREVFHPPLFSTPPWRPLKNEKDSWGRFIDRGQKNCTRKKKKILVTEVPRNFSDQFSGRRAKSSQELCSWELFFLILVF